MCASCGCGLVNEDHGDDRHLTLRDLEAAAEAAGIDVGQMVNNLQEAVELAQAETSATSAQ